MEDDGMTRMSRAAAAMGLAALAAGAPISLAGDKVQPPPSVTVLGKSLVLKSNLTSPTEDLVAEYVPASETLENWTLMLGIRIFKGTKLTPDQALAVKTGEVEARRAQGDYLANSAAFAKGELKVIDFLMSQPPIVEHNIMSFSRRPDGRLISYQIARRYYQPSSEVDDGLRAFVSGIKENRDRYVNEVERLANEVPLSPRERDFGPPPPP
jgi:hypothetical protein